MITLYHAPLSINSRRVWVTLLEKGLEEHKDFQLEIIDLTKGEQLKPEFVALNPFHHVPVLVDKFEDKENTIIESFAILEYLEAKYPDKPPEHPLMPKIPDPKSKENTSEDPKEAKSKTPKPNSLEMLARVRMVQMVTLTELVPAIGPLTTQALFDITQDPEVLKQANKQAETVFKFWEQQLGDDDFFGGEHLSLADIVAGTLADWLPEEIGLPLADYPKLKEWRSRLMERQAWQDTKVKKAELDAFKIKIKQQLAETKVWVGENSPLEIV